MVIYTNIMKASEAVNLTEITTQLLEDGFEKCQDILPETEIAVASFVKSTPFGPFYLFFAMHPLSQLIYWPRLGKKTTDVKYFQGPFPLKSLSANITAMEICLLKDAEKIVDNTSKLN